MKLYNSGAAVLLAIAILSIEVNAQSLTGVGLELSGGLTQLNHEASGLHRNGTHGQVAVLMPFRTLLSDALQLDLGYHSIPGKPSPNATIPNAALVVVSLEAVKQLVEFKVISLYALAGAGTYSLNQGSGRESHLGVNAGGGVSVPVGRHHAFAEGRFHQIFTGEPNGFWPLSLGFRL